MHAPQWNVTKSADTYRFQTWGSQYFSIGEDGNLRVRPAPEDRQADYLSVVDLVDELKKAGGSLPALFRFPEILKHRVCIIAKSFETAIQKYRFRGRHHSCFPIKTNQRWRVIHAISESGAGLEVGTKSELLLGANLAIKKPDIPLLCNGYKDRDYVELAMRLTQAGTNLTLTLENPGEVELLIECAKRLNIRPRLGLRLRLDQRSRSRWGESSGPSGMFGMSGEELIWAIDQLRAAGLTNSVKMIHYHLGSQVTNIETVRDAATEAARIYADLIEEKLPLEAVDIGGGLGVGYFVKENKTRKKSDPKFATPNSIQKHFSVKSYADAVISAFSEGCQRANVNHPNIFTESGRGVAAQHAMLVFDVFASPPTHEKTFTGDEASRSELRLLQSILSQPKPNLKRAREVRKIITLKHRVGLVPLRERAEADRLLRIAENHLGKFIRKKYYFGNFSIFQSLPDCWGVNEVFPVMPIHKLHEFPSESVVLADITCDSDGKFRVYQDGKDTIQLHPIPKDESYLVGVYDVGAYQETIGDIHNLLGRTSAMSVLPKANGKWDFRLESETDTAAEVASSIGHITDKIEDNITAFFDAACARGKISNDECEQSKVRFKSVMHSSPYLNLHPENDDVANEQG